MELRQLEYFVAVAEEQNFTRAAERVHISQSGVSAQIRQLERELGAELFDRSGRRATLTAAGDAALEHARAALASVDALRQAVQEVNELLRGHLTVGMVTACTITALFDALADLHRAHPGIRITLLEDSSDVLIERVRSGAIDLALVGYGGEPGAGVETLPIVAERLVACAPLDHPLAGRARVRLADVVAHPVVCMPRGTGIRAVFDHGCAAQDLRPTVALEASAPDTVADLAARGLGVAVLSESMAEAYRPRLYPAVITDVRLPAVLALVWRPGASPALRALLERCRAAFAAPRASSATAAVRARRSRRRKMS